MPRPRSMTAISRTRKGTTATANSTRLWPDRRRSRLADLGANARSIAITSARPVVDGDLGARREALGVIGVLRLDLVLRPGGQVGIREVAEARVDDVGAGRS